MENIGIASMRMKAIPRNWSFRHVYCDLSNVNQSNVSSSRMLMENMQRVRHCSHDGAEKSILLPYFHFQSSNFHSILNDSNYAEILETYLTYPSAIKVC